MRVPADRFRRLRHALLAVALGTTLIAPPSALASGTDVWNDCGDADGAINHRHSQADYREALADPPADGAEYSNCLDLIRQAQLRDASGGPGATGGTGSKGGTGGTGIADAPVAVAPADLSKALKRGGIDPSQPVAAGAVPAPAPVTVDGKQIDLASERAPSIASALSLPLPLAASAVVVLLSAGLPLARYVVARFGGPPTGTTSSAP